MKIDKDTKLFFSISEKPGNFGATFFNFAFDYFGINAIYKPLKIDKKYNNYEDFFRLMYGLEATGTSGISVSMPFKKLAYLYCKPLEEAKKIKNINTILYDNKPLGYNTDCLGFKIACHNILKKTKTAVIYGNGAVADSIKFILDGWCIPNATITRNKARLTHMQQLRNRDNSFKWDLNSFSEYDLLINASPVGMDGIEDNIFTEEMVSRYKYVFDVVGNKETNLIKLAKKQNKEYSSGMKMQFYGACEQLKIYLHDQVHDEFIPERILLEYMLKHGYDLGEQNE